MLDEDAGDLSTDEAQYLRLVRDEGLELLANFRRIRDVEKRRLVIDLSAMLAEPPPEKA